MNQRSATMRASSNQLQPRDRAKLAAQIRAARAVLNWSQTELAARTSLTQHTICRLEQGGASMRAATAAAISTAFAQAGIQIEDTPDGGFSLAISGPLLPEAEAEREDG
ncbi:MAG TPA: helix-turn-helix transcriptional regulator [Xanthobacteraceae bacterium]|jgi:transcriptional regulator with XRE-family HTH domain